MKDFRSEAAARLPFATTAGHDHKAWAKRILYREERKDTLLTPLQVSFVRAAMGAKQEGEGA